MSTDEKYMYYDKAGREVHVFEDENGNEVKIIDMDAADYVYMGDQWCPHCLIQIYRDKPSRSWTCPTCGYEISDDEILDNDGIPSFAAALDWRMEHGLD